MNTCLVKIASRGLMMALLCGSSGFGNEVHSFYYENVLGTRLELQIDSLTDVDANKAESTALDEIDRLESVYSSYVNSSELNQWLSQKTEKALSQEMVDLLVRSEYWIEKSDHAFHPGVELLSRIWKRAELAQKIPERSELEEAVHRLQHRGWDWYHNKADARPCMPLNFNAIAKGVILDAVCERLSHLSNIRGGRVAIGGDMRSFGTHLEEVHVVVPRDDLLAQTLSTVSLRNRSLATSSGVHRGFEIQGKHYSHIIDPRTGMPSSNILHVTVIAPTAADADAMATACSVLRVPESLKMIEARPDAACLILDSEGSLFASSKWQNFETLPKMVSFQNAVPDWNQGMEMKIDFSIHQPENTRRYRRPYVALWIEDRDGKSVRTLVLWIHNTGHGQRWLPELSRWYRNDTSRMQKDDLDLVKTVSEATRRPGAYSVTWNGLDDHKKILPNGEYTLCIEASREQGSHQLIRKKISIGDEPFQVRLDDNSEIDNASIIYRKKQSKF